MLTVTVRWEGFVGVVGGSTRKGGVSPRGCLPHLPVCAGLQGAAGKTQGCVHIWGGKATKRDLGGRVATLPC